MAESFGRTLTLVEVTADSGVEPARELWIAWAKPDQAVTMVLLAVPEGWTAEVLAVDLTGDQRAIIGSTDLKPGEVRKLPGL